MFLCNGRGMSDQIWSLARRFHKSRLLMQVGDIPASQLFFVIVPSRILLKCLLFIFYMSNPYYGAFCPKIGWWVLAGIILRLFEKGKIFWKERDSQNAALAVWFVNRSIDQSLVFAKLGWSKRFIFSAGPSVSPRNLCEIWHIILCVNVG